MFIGMSILIYMVIFHIILSVFFKRINEKENATMASAFLGGAFIILFLVCLPLFSMLFDPMGGFEYMSMNFRIILWGLLYIVQASLYTGLMLSMNTYKRKYKIQKIKNV